MDFNTSKSIRKQIIKEMRDGQYSKENRLPRETVLAENFGISRNHLRDILAQLESEGFITRRHGIGTVINHHVLNVRNRADIEMELLDIIRQHGYEAGLTDLRFWEDSADDYTAKKMNIPVGEPVLHVVRICTADGSPAVYCEDIVQKKLIKKEFKLKDLEPPIFYFLKEFCDIDVYMDLTQLHAVIADKDVTQALDLVEGTPLLNMEEVDYDINGEIAFYSRQYFVDAYFEHSVMRKKL